MELLQSDASINSSTVDTNVEDTSSDGLSEMNLFDGLTAWFSDSVSAVRKTSWIENNGLVVSDNTNAMFVFSEDAGCEDTSSLYRTEAYLDEHLAVFHPAYIDKCLEETSMEKVPIGQYFMPPTEIQKAIQNDTVFIWQTRKDVKREKTTGTKKDNQNMETTERPSEEYIHIDDLEQVEGALEDFVIGENGCMIKRTKEIVEMT